MPRIVDQSISPPKSYGKLKMPQTVQNYSEDSLRHFCV